jgi:Phosphotransferase enzyme family
VCRAVDDDIPRAVLSRAVGAPVVSASVTTKTPLAGSTGAATSRVTRIRGTAQCTDGRSRSFALVRKEISPLSSGPHVEAARHPRHWAYWLREPFAYASGALPSGPGLSAPRCYGVIDTTIYLEDVTGRRESPGRAAYRLGRWQATAVPPDVPWLGGHQLAQRIVVSDLAWSGVAADERAVEIWNRRHEILAMLERVPVALTHGDFHLANLVHKQGETVVLDWGTLGLSPVGADLAHLALSTLSDVTSDYLAGVQRTFSTEAVLAGYRGTLALVGASRLHWMLAAGHDVPAGYLDFVWANRPS